MKFSVANVAQIKKAKVEFGDLTVLIGEQGTGKSIFLQLFKFKLDENYIKQTMQENGESWETRRQNFLAAYLSNPTKSLWNNNSKIQLTEERNDSVLQTETYSNREQVIYIPAQRAIVIPDGWPLSYRNYALKTPFVVRNFSERIRLYLENKPKENIFPITGKLKQGIKEIINNAVFHGATIYQPTEQGKKELKLAIDGDVNNPLSYLAWSAGQREFVPLLIGCYELLPGGNKTKEKGINWVIVEEPEMGLHPKAIFSAMLLVLDLMSRGYKVIVSTHSTSVVDIVWAIKDIQAATQLDCRKKVDLLLKLFDITVQTGLTQQYIQLMQKLMEKIVKKDFRTYYFTYAKDFKVISKDISTLDPGSEDLQISGWGGLSSYSGHAADIVAEAYTDE